MTADATVAGITASGARPTHATVTARPAAPAVAVGVGAAPDSAVAPRTAGRRGITCCPVSASATGSGVAKRRRIAAVAPVATRGARHGRRVGCSVVTGTTVATVSISGTARDAGGTGRSGRPACSSSAGRTT